MSGRKLPYFLILIPISFILYANTIHSSFIFDDSIYILENPMIRDLANFIDLSGTRYVGLLSFALNYVIGGYDPYGYHIVNILIHGLNGILVYLFISALLSLTTFSSDAEGLPGSKAVALAAALLFLVHPVQTQAVSYITQRFVSLTTLFYLLTIVLYLYSRRNSGRKKVIFYIAALASALLAYKTKEISFTLPVVLLLVEAGFIKGAGPLKRSVLFLVPFFLLAAIIPIETFITDVGADPLLAVSEMDFIHATKLKDLASLSSYNYLMTEFRVVVTYLRLLVLPVNQVVDYDFPRYDTFTAPPVFLSFIFLAVIFGVGVYLFYISRRKAKSEGGNRSRDVLLLFSTGILWFFITMSIESSVIPIEDHIFEHRIYLPSVGFAMIAVAIFYAAGNYFSGVHAKVRSPLKYFWAIVICIALILSIATIVRNRVWANNITMWTDVVRKAPNNSRGYLNLAREYIVNKDYANARKYLLKGIELSPDDIKGRINLGNTYYVEGDIENALIQYEAAVRIDNENYRALYTLGLVYQKLGRISDAREMYSESLHFNPAFNPAREKLREIDRQDEVVKDRDD